MNNIFELKTGKLVFEEDKIVITDNAKTFKYSRLFSIAIFLTLSFSNLTDYVRHDKIPALWTGLFLGIVGILMLVFFFLTDTQSEIYLKEVKSMKVRRIFFKEVLRIKLANNLTRQVSGIYNTERLEEYIKTLSPPK